MDLRTFYEREVLGRILDRAMRGTGPLRLELLSGLEGRVCEIGFGTGLNLPFYSPKVAELVAVDPSAGLLERARPAVQRSGLRVELLETSASRPLPLAPGSFDAVVITFVLCSVQRVEAMLAEAARLLRPDAPLLVLEHVRADSRWKRGVQRAVRPAWSGALGGCDPCFDAHLALDLAGFDPRTLRPVSLPLPFPVSSGVTGRVTLR